MAVVEARDDQTRSVTLLQCRVRCRYLIRRGLTEVAAIAFSSLVSHVTHGGKCPCLQENIVGVHSGSP